MVTIAFGRDTLSQSRYGFGFLSSEAYKPVKAMRLQASEATITVVEGLS